MNDRVSEDHVEWEVPLVIFGKQSEASQLPKSVQVKPSGTGAASFFTPISFFSLFAFILCFSVYVWNREKIYYSMVLGIMSLK